jgi:lysophospholipase L1-like esterase
VYIRKVHFRDAGMIKQIEEKVVNRLRQVTSAIKQAGANQVSVITSSAEREAAIEFAKAAAIRPATLGQALQEIAREPAVAEALFDVLERGCWHRMRESCCFRAARTPGCWRT